MIMGFDITGSNIDNARVAQQKFPALMGLLTKYLTDPQVAIWANDDIKASTGRLAPVQLSDFESDNRIDEHIRNVWLVGDGGGNFGESYNLLLYAAARKTVLDCFDKRGRKGYMFMYADEPIYSPEGHSHSSPHRPFVEKADVKAAFGDDIEADIPISEIIEEVKNQYHLFVIWPQRGYDDAKAQYIELFGEESVLTLQDPALICELVASVVGLNENKITEADAIDDLVSVGVSKHHARTVINSASTALAVAGTSTALTRKGGTARL